MGIDLAHVRYVIHWSMAKTVEGFYQESGRGGRDGKNSKSILYYSSEDASKFQFLIRKASESKASKTKSSLAIEEEHSRSMDALTKMINYCTQPCCRRQYLLRHFGEEIDVNLVCKKTCDYCVDPGCMERAMEKSMIDRAKRDVKRQQQSFNSAKKWYGDYDDSDGDGSIDEFKDESDLCITHYDASHEAHSFNGTKTTKTGFKSVRDVLSHYEVSFHSISWLCCMYEISSNNYFQ